MSRRLRLRRTVIPALLLLLALAAGGGWRLYSVCRNTCITPFKAYLAAELVFEIPRGEPVAQTARRLEEQGVVASALLLRTALWLQGSEASIKAGTYRFDRPLSLPEVLHKLTSGDVAYQRVTIPEGYDLAQIMALLVEAGLGSVPGYAAAIRRTASIQDLDPLATDLEGYLLPDTYHFDFHSSEEAVLARMLANFRAFWDAGRSERARRLGMTVREVVTLASLVEKETGTPSERPLVSAVFHNRLRLGMKLMCDPTVIYAVRAVKDYDGIIHQSDLRLDSPYNTYLYAGLPPGPICNPGRAALDAALQPAETDYLYFVSRNDGTHHFSAGYDQHRRAVNRYQR